MGKCMYVVRIFNVLPALQHYYWFYITLLQRCARFSTHLYNASTVDTCLSETWRPKLNFHCNKIGTYCLSRSAPASCKMQVRREVWSAPVRAGSGHRVASLSAVESRAVSMNLFSSHVKFASRLEMLSSLHWFFSFTKIVEIWFKYLHRIGNSK